MNCLFCNIAQNEKERMTIYEDESLVLIMDKFPICDGHALVIPKKHFEDIYEVMKRLYLICLKLLKNMLKF